MIEIRELIEMMENITQSGKANAEQNLVAFLVSLENMLISGKSVTLPLFGTFKRVENKNGQKQYGIVFDADPEFIQQLNYKHEVEEYESKGTCKESCD